MKRAIGYLRVSTDKQEDGNGYASQCAVIQGWCERNGYELWFVVRDSVSGASEMEDRIVFVDLVSSMVEELGSSTLVIRGRDRLARDFIAAGMLEKLANKRGVTIATADGLGIVDSSTPHGMLVKGMLDLLAQWDKMNTVARLSAGQVNASRYRGKHMRLPPYGYIIGAAPGHREICQPEADAIRKIFWYHDVKAWAPVLIMEWLNANGFTRREGARWQTRDVRDILKYRKVYQGLELPNKAFQLAPGVTPKHPAILSPEQNGYNPYEFKLAS